MTMNIREKELSKRLRKVREEKGFAREKLAREADISTSALYNYERGTQEPTVSVLNKLASILNVSVDYLLGNTDEPSTASASNEEAKRQIVEKVILNLPKGKKIDVDEIRKKLGEYYVESRHVPYLDCIPTEKSLDELLKDTKETFMVPKKVKIDFALKIQDDSMEPKFKNGDVALCVRENKLTNDDIGVFIGSKEGGIVREYHEYGDTIVLRAINPNCENNEMIIPKKKFKREWKIAAGVTGIFHTLRTPSNR